VNYCCSYVKPDEWIWIMKTSNERLAYGLSTLDLLFLQFLINFSWYLTFKKGLENDRAGKIEHHREKSVLFLVRVFHNFEQAYLVQLLMIKSTLRLATVLEWEIWFLENYSHPHTSEQSCLQCTLCNFCTNRRRTGHLTSGIKNVIRTKSRLTRA